MYRWLSLLDFIPALQGLHENPITHHRKIKAIYLRNTKLIFGGNQCFSVIHCSTAILLACQAYCYLLPYILAYYATF